PSCRTRVDPARGGCYRRGQQGEGTREVGRILAAAPSTVGSPLALPPTVESAHAWYRLLTVTGRDRSVGKGGGSNLSWTDLALEEYRALRAEVVATMQTQGNSLSFGSATLGLVAAGAFNVWKEAFLTTVIFMFVVPFVCSLVLIIWMGEVTMMHRAGE